ncbi:hypothetical protein RIF29_26244 [Crotalaria pallida]|uniref:Alpha/beta hydrolase fold-3 domain-containing protein n=1 Tax=Crotalaria pallida TaxID=3830 RepID=A0AAN9HXZ8_CROPI
MSKFDPYEHFGISLNPDGTLNRPYHPTTEPNPEPSPGNPTVSKDVTLDKEKKTWLRIFRPTKLPSNDNTVARLPILIHFHYGGFILRGPDDEFVHAKCSQLSSIIPAIVVAVAYRRAPEHRLPAQYHDGVDGVLWVKDQMNDPDGEQWVREYGDPSRCYLFGCGSGANIAFFTAMQVHDKDLHPLRICGVIMNQAMFGGEKRTSSELRCATDQLFPLPAVDMLWELALPKETDRDHRYCNPMIKGPHLNMVEKLKRCLVIGYGGDIFVDRQQELVTMLVKRGVQVEARFDPAGFHSIDLVDPTRAAAVINIVKEFIL